MQNRWHGEPTSHFIIEPLSSGARCWSFTATFLITSFRESEFLSALHRSDEGNPGKQTHSMKLLEAVGESSEPSNLRDVTRDEGEGKGNFLEDSALSLRNHKTAPVEQRTTPNERFIAFTIQTAVRISNNFQKEKSHATIKQLESGLSVATRQLNFKHSAEEGKFVLDRQWVGTNYFQVAAFPHSSPVFAMTVLWPLVKTSLKVTHTRTYKHKHIYSYHSW